ncbi:MAG TPA: hypothetical protein P5272_02035 [Caldisericia bacterium]|nr:hypothetical protein [Caldisericia bacterium]HPC57244.1 hypothetical protein [Caldisericia bacterium]HRT37668.1 hypothetical protein [Caldisericia bacterium]HRU73745.1 hypothetical protein [Caldisericia bacterium]
MFELSTIFFIIVVLATFFILILGLIFAIYIVYNKHSNDIDDLSDKEKKIIDESSIKETANKNLNHIYFL